MWAILDATEEFGDWHQGTIVRTNIGSFWDNKFTQSPYIYISGSMFFG